MSTEIEGGAAVSASVDLARRAVACKGWRWMPGMRVVSTLDCIDEHHHEPGRVTGVTRYKWGVFADVFDDDGDINSVSAGSLLPDLDDPATLGCLLALVREAWGDPTISPAPVPSFDHGCSWRISMTGNDHARVFMNLGGRLWRLTEADALVAALEAAP